MSKYVSFTEIMRMVKTHACTVGAIFLLGILIFARVITSSIGGVIYSAAATVVYFFSMYNTAYDVAVRNKKSYTEEKPYTLKGLILPVGLLIVSMLMCVLDYIVWNYMTIDGAIVGASGIILNVLFVAWTFVYNGFLNIASGAMEWYGYAMLGIIPFVASFFGYLAGIKGFDITGVFMKLVYEDMDKSGKDNG